MRRFPATATPELTPAQALRLAFDLFEFGEKMKRASLRREHPDASDEAIERLVVEWLQTRPGAEHGDSAGRPCRRRAIGG